MRATVLFSILALAAAAVFFGIRDEPDGRGEADSATELTRGATPRSALAAAAEDGEPSPRTIDREHPGYAIYTRRGCNVCHGGDLGGTNMAPSLHEAGEHWTSETFGRYLANPDSSIRADARLRALDAKYGMFVMPAYPLDEDELAPLSALVLGEER